MSDHPIPATRIVRHTHAAARVIDAEIVVVGAGISGISAALEAAKLGRRVVLVDARQQLGGQSTGSMLGTFCGFYSNGPEPYPRRLWHGRRDVRASETGGRLASAPRPQQLYSAL